MFIIQNALPLAHSFRPQPYRVVWRVLWRLNHLFQKSGRLEVRLIIKTRLMPEHCEVCGAKLSKLNTSNECFQCGCCLAKQNGLTILAWGNWCWKNIHYEDLTSIFQCHIFISAHSLAKKLKELAGPTANIYQTQIDGVGGFLLHFN